MSNLHSNARTDERQISFTLPLGATSPRFVIGQVVEVLPKYQHAYGLRGGLVVGMTWTSRDAALAENSGVGWDYVLEVDPFSHSYSAHFIMQEDWLKLPEAQEVSHV